MRYTDVYFNFFTFLGESFTFSYNIFQNSHRASHRTGEKSTARFFRATFASSAHNMATGEFGKGLSVQFGLIWYQCRWHCSRN